MNGDKLNIALLVLVVFLLITSSKAIGFNFTSFGDFGNAIDFLGRWFPMNTNIFWPMVNESALTLAIAFLGSFLGLMIALPFSFWATDKTSGSMALTRVVRTVMNFLRSIPEIVTGLVFLTILGPGPFPAVLALIIHNIGVFAKIISERIEEEPPGPYEALTALGARPAVASYYGLLPQILPTVFSQYFYRFEVAIRTSLILGFVGGGGIGQQLFNHFNTFQYPSVAMDVTIIMIIVIVVDIISLRVQKAVI